VELIWKRVELESVGLVVLKVLGVEGVEVEIFRLGWQLGFVEGARGCHAVLSLRLYGSQILSLELLHVVVETLAQDPQLAVDLAACIPGWLSVSLLVFLK